MLKTIIDRIKARFAVKVVEVDPRMYNCPKCGRKLANSFEDTIGSCKGTDHCRVCRQCFEPGSVTKAEMKVICTKECPGYTKNHEKITVACPLCHEEEEIFKEDRISRYCGGSIRCQLCEACYGAGSLIEHKPGSCGQCPARPEWVLNG